MSGCGVFLGNDQIGLSMVARYGAMSPAAARRLAANVRLTLTNYIGCQLSETIYQLAFNLSRNFSSRVDKML